MPEQLRNILNRIKEWWGKFTNRQRGIIIGLTAMTIIVFAVIIYVVSIPQYTVLMTCDTTKSASEVTEILTSNGIEYKTSTDALQISVPSDKIAVAELALAAGGYVADEYTLETALNSSLSTTAADTAKKYKLYQETLFKASLEAMEGIRSAKVSFSIPEQNGTLASTKEESSAYIQLETDGTINSAKAYNIAKAAATVLGNSSTNNITILDSEGNLLFSGGDDSSVSGVASSFQELQNNAENYVELQVKKVVLGTSQYNSVEVTTHLDMDYSTYEDTKKTYTVEDGRTEGYLSHSETYESETTSGVGGVPGTDSNGEGTTYVTADNSESSSTTAETVKDYLPNEESMHKQTPAGNINYNNSSLSIAAITYKELREEDAKTQGLLDGITWDEYKLSNSGDTKLEVSEDFYSMVSTATGIPTANITIIAYESPIFYDKESVNVSWTTVLSAVLLILILGLLAFVVLRSMGQQKEVEEEPEVSVEQILQSTPENVIEDIDVETKSETRLMIEKFVDENPESAAALLRNWLNDDWA